MKKNLNTRKWFKNLTSKMAWDEYVGMSERIFISNFYAEDVKDIGKMCKIYASEVPGIYSYEGILFDVDELKIIERLLTQHLKEYLKKIGGIENMAFYTVEELDKMIDDTYEEIVQLAMARYNITREQFFEVISKSK